MRAMNWSPSPAGSANPAGSWPTAQTAMKANPANRHTWNRTSDRRSSESAQARNPGDRASSAITSSGGASAATPMPIGGPAVWNAPAAPAASMTANQTSVTVSSAVPVRVVVAGEVDMAPPVVVTCHSQVTVDK